MNPIQPIEPSRPLHPTRRVERERGGGEPKQQPHGGRQDGGREQDDAEDDGLPHVDVRA